MKNPFKSSFLLFIIYRISSVFIIQTFYVPDEYWQSLEVAHNIAFGYGYLTWEWKHGLRSYLYPSCIALIYNFLKFFGIDYLHFIIIIPRLFQAVLTAVSDQYFVLLCRNFGFDEYWAKIYLLTNWFWYYCGCRTIANTVETCLTIISLYYFPWFLFKSTTKRNKIEHSSLKYMTLSAINCVIRPTAATIWGPLVLFHLSGLTLEKSKQLFIKSILPVFISVLVVTVSIDFLFYGKFIIPVYNFLVFNVFKNISSFYGTHPFHWYFTQGLPAILGLHLLPFCLGFVKMCTECYKTNNSLKKIFIIWILILFLNILILSNIPHKEFRFILPLLPLIMLIAVKHSTDYFQTSTTLKSIWTLCLVLTFIILSILFGMLHQQGPLKLMNYLSSAKCLPSCSFLFLMPCHSTPLYSHLHVNVSTKILTCEPPIDDNIFDESDYFFNNPIQWLGDYWDDENPPSHIALFDKMDSSVNPFLEKRGFIKKHSFLHTLFAQENNGKYIIVYEPS